MAIDRLLHKLLDQDNLKYGFFTRNGGVSESPFNSLNCSLRVNDKLNNVQENLRLISEELQLDKIIKG